MISTAYKLLMLHFLPQLYCDSTDLSEEVHFWSTPIFSESHSHEGSPDPYHVLVVYGHNFCSGTFIGSKIVLTVASCFERGMKKYDVFVKYGCKHFLDEGQVKGVVEIKTHEYYQYRSVLDNDIALLLLEGHVHFDKTVKKILLIDPDSMWVPVGSVITISGWGAKNSAKSQERYIVHARMMVINQEECLKTYEEVLTSSMFCAKYIKSRLSDNGGHASQKGFLVGVYSYGASEEQKIRVALLTNVSYFYKWIKLNTERLLTKYCSYEDDR